MSERPSIHETGPETTAGERSPHTRTIDPEFARNLGHTATRTQVADSAQVAPVQRGVGEVAVRGAQRSEPRASGRDRPPSPENHERS
jgi:hypothetical protein